MHATRWRRLVFLLCVGPLLAGGWSGAPLPEQPTAPAGQWRTLAGEPRDAVETDAFLRRLMEQHHVTALSVAVIAGGRTVYEHTLGSVDPATGRPADGRTVFRAASLTKPVFAYLVMKLVDEGVLDLDTPIHRYLKKPVPAYPAYASFRDDPRYEHLTARLLLSHQGGLPNWRQVRPDGPIQFHANPGDHFAYSGEGYTLLQFVIENVTGLDLATLARNRVFVPLAMNDTSFLWESRFDGRFAVELRSGIGRLIAGTRLKGNAAASIITNASDYATFLGAVLNGTGLEPTTGAVMLEPQVALTSRSLFSPPGTDAGLNRAHKMAWTPGWGTFEDAYGRALFHVGREEGCENYAEAFLDRKLGVAILSLTASSDSFSAPLVDYVIGSAYSPLEWLEYGESPVQGTPGDIRRAMPLALAAVAVVLVVLALGLRRRPPSVGSRETLAKPSWQRRPVTQILAVIVVYVPLYVFALWSHLSHQAITLRELFLYPLMLGGGNVVLALLIYRFICGERIASLNLKSGKWFTDVPVGILLAAVFLALLALQQGIQSRWLPRTPGPPPLELITLFRGIVNNPFLLAIWLGPVAWLGVAAFEEVSRVFMLNRLWTVWPQPTARWFFLTLSACLFGLVHIYQSPVSVVAIGLQGFIYGCYYMRFGRLWPMIIGHALYDSFQVVQVVIAFQRA